MRFISKEVLDKISYESGLGKSLKQISLRKTALSDILVDDVLGFRLYFEEYPETFPEYFRVVDLRKGKKTDDGYRAIHLYYQKDNLAYPIEIQLWCAEDYQFNIWSHKMVYKYHTAEIGKQLYEKYRSGSIKSEEEFRGEMKKLMEGCETSGKG